MMVTATASTSVPKGSPTRCATTSAWWTAANTVAKSAITATATRAGGVPMIKVIPKITQAIAGDSQVQTAIRLR